MGELSFEILFLTLKIGKTTERLNLHISIFIVIFRGANRA